MSIPIRTVGLVFQNHDYHRRVFSGILEYVRPYRNWQMERISATADALAAHRGRAFDGLIGAITDSAAAETACALGIPTINVSGLGYPRGITTVASDEDMIGQMAANYLIRQNVRYFSWVGAPDLISINRGQGFCRALQELGEGPRLYELPESASINATLLYSDKTPFAQWLTAAPKPLGIFCPTDIYAFFTHQVARHCGLDMTRDLHLIGVDNQIDYCEAVYPPFSSIELGMVGFRAAEILERMMNGQSVPALIRVPPREVVSRGGKGDGPAHGPEVQAVNQLIASRLGERLQIDDLLQGIPLSRRYIEKQFKKATGRSIYQEVQRQRIERAKMLLTSTAWSIERVGEASGIPDPRQFSRAFRQHTGLSPVKYRKRVGVG
jgi:LacI family transcriptional regulator